MMEFIEENYQWFFSGIGVTLLVSILRYMWTQIGKNEDTPQQPVQKKKSTNQSEELCSQLTVSSELGKDLYGQESTLSPHIELVAEDGSVKRVEVVIAFMFEDTKQEYIVYTEGEQDRYNNTTVYVSKVDKSNGTPRLIGVDDNSEWERVKNALKLMAMSGDEQPVYDESGIELL